MLKAEIQVKKTNLHLCFENLNFEMTAPLQQQRGSSINDVTQQYEQASKKSRLKLEYRQRERKKIVLHRKRASSNQNV
jgi:hypothetical protein